MVNDFVYDIETFPNVFTMTVEHVALPITWVFEISHRRDDSHQIIEFMDWLRSIGARMVGFNNLGFDYPVIHLLYRMGRGDAATLYAKAMSIIQSQNTDGNDRWSHQVYPSDRIVPQVDLFKIHHFDNRARSTSLKALEFNMRSDSIEDLPFPVGTVLNSDQIDVLLHYNAHDVKETKKFYHQSIDMIRFREELSQKYQRDFINHNDTKIGKDYFIMMMEQAGVSCYDYSPDTGRTPRQTQRDVIHLKDAILPWIKFTNPEFQRVLDWLKSQSIIETKGIFKDLTAMVNGFTFVFGLGGIHGSIEHAVIENDDDHVIIDLDVTSYYPNLAITNNLYPAHLGSVFVEIFKSLFEQRRTYPKKSAENAMLKLALNGVYGDSNNPYSVFYDPLFTMSITLNGQLLLCLLAQELMKIPGLQLIQANTDGLTLKVPVAHVLMVETVRHWWQIVTKLNLEASRYQRLFVRDVNNYLGQYVDGTVKRKGAYEWETEWHQNASALVIPKVAEKVLLNGAPIRDTVQNWPDIMDFMLLVKVPRSSRLTIEDEFAPQFLQNTTRYHVAVDGGYLFKHMPPLKGKTDWRKIAVESGWKVRVCNRITDARPLDINHEYYIQEVEKLVLELS